MLKIDCTVEGFSGSVSVPEVLRLDQLGAWWQVAIGGQKDRTRLEWEYWATQFEAARRLVLDCGSWDVVGVPKGDVEAGVLPAPVAEWLVEEIETYISPQLSKKKRRLMSTVL